MDRTIIDWLDSSENMYGRNIYLKDREGSISFEEHNQLAKAIGSFVAGKCNKGDAVIVLSGRHRYTPSCFHGVARAGCVYVPLDSSMPAKRLNQIIKIVDSKLLIVDDDSLDLLKSLEYAGEVVHYENICKTAAATIKLATFEKYLPLKPFNANPAIKGSVTNATNPMHPPTCP